MKQLIYLLYLISITSIAQVKGNKTIETKTFPFKNVEAIKIDLYAKVTIDPSAEESLTITTESNLFQYIDTEIVDGVIHLSQLKWIQPTQDIIIKIGAPSLKRIVHDTHDTTKVINLDNRNLNIIATIGKVIVEGKANELHIGVENARVDALKTQANSVYVNLWGWGTVSVNPLNYLKAEVAEDGKLFYSQLPERNSIKTKSNGKVLPINKKKSHTKKSITWINFKIKNNSVNRNHFIVKGPKADGSYFGYGFPMMPFSKRKEKWSVGTKIYKENKLGFKKLLVTIKAEDEGKTINLF